MKHFASIKVINDQERPLCLLCINTLASDSMKPNKLIRHLVN